MGAGSSHKADPGGCCVLMWQCCGPVLAAQCADRPPTLTIVVQAREAHRGRWVAGLVTVALGVTLAGCNLSTADTTTRDESGEITEAGTVGVFQLQEGDCLIVEDVPDSNNLETTSDYGAVPCEDEHTGEVILVDDDFYSAAAEFPGEEAAFAQGQESCVSAIEDYTQTSFDDSPYDVITLVPTSASWTEIDDRELVCVGVTLNDDWTDIVATTGSMQAR